MAQRFGGKYSPEDTARTANSRKRRAKVDAAGGRSNVMFLTAILLLATSLTAGAQALTLAVVGSGVFTLGAWLLREGLRAEAAFHARNVARKPALPRKILAAALAGIGTVIVVFVHNDMALDFIAPMLYGLCVSALHLVAFGIDPLKSKGMEGVDTFQQDRVARVVDEAEKHLTAMTDALKRAGCKKATAKLAEFQMTVRELIRTVEEDPRDLTATRKYLGVYLQGAREATVKFADIFSRTQDVAARDDYLSLLDDLEDNFSARNQKSLLDDRSDLTVEIDVLRERLSREGVRIATQNTSSNTSRGA